MDNRTNISDEIDVRILDYVQRNGRDGLAEIGAAVGLSVSAVNERLKRLQHDKVITGWGARVDANAIGYGVLVFMLVAVRLQVEPAFRRWIDARPEVLESHHVTGDWSYLLKLRTSSIAALDAFLEETKKQRVIDRSHTLLALSTLKETAVLPVRLDAPDTEQAKGSARRPRSPAK